MENKLIKIGAVVNWRGSWGHEVAKQTTITSIQFCEMEGGKYGIEMQEVWAIDKDRCCFGLSNNHWAYGHQIDLLPESIIESTY